MARNPKFSNLAVNTKADALGVLLNSGYLRIYDGTQPLTADTAVTTQVLLAELRFAATAFAAASGGIITAAAIVTDAAADATGTASWFRALKSDGTTVVYDGSAGNIDVLNALSYDLVMNTTSITVGIGVAVTALTITESKG